MANKTMIAEEKRARDESAVITAKKKAAEKAERKRLGGIAVMEQKYLGKRVRAPMVDDPEGPWVTGEVTGVGIVDEHTYRLIVRGSNGVEVYCIQRKALLS